MRLTKNELIFLKQVTDYNSLAGSFDFENNSKKEFKHAYGLSMLEVDRTAKSLRTKVLDTLKNTQLRASK